MRRIVLTLAGAAVLAACGAAGGAGSTSPPGTSAPAATGPTVSTGTTSLGTVLTNAQGLTLYYFLPEVNSTIGACTGGCLSAWPPLTVTGSPMGTSAVTGTLATVPVMLNGASVNEVTYNGWPLHTFSSDASPGQTNGQGVSGKWFVAMPGTTSTSTGTSSSSSTPPPAATPTPSSAGGYGY